MTTSKHGRRPLARLALAAGGVGTLIAVAAAAQFAAHRLGATAGAALAGAVFAGCWIVFRVRPLLHPARPRAAAMPARSGNASPEAADRDLLPLL